MLETNPQSVCQDLKNIRKNCPLVHNITNYVAMNFTANGLLALGASPVMAHAIEEVRDMSQIAGALVLNIGTLSPEWVGAMFIAGQTAKLKQTPVILDPVGAGATKYRTQTCVEIINHIKPNIIRGNASEILSLALGISKTKGVDSSESSENVLGPAKKLSKQTNAIVVVSGETDIITDGNSCIKIKNGHALMPKITAMGCMASAFVGAFAAVNKNYGVASANAMAVMGICGEMAAKNSQGPGSFISAFLDAAYLIGEKEINSFLKIEKLQSAKV